MIGGFGGFTTLSSRAGCNAHFNAALNVDNRNAEGWANLGVAYEKQGNRSKATESYNRAMEVDPQNALAREGLRRLG